MKPYPKQETFSFFDVESEFEDLAPHIVKAFWTYHEKNPEVWKLLIKFADQVLAAGRDRYGIQALFERIRWYSVVETRGDSFKINNNHCSCYARLLALKHPRFKNLFATRVSPGTVRD